MVENGLRGLFGSGVGCCDIILGLFFYIVNFNFNFYCLFDELYVIFKMILVILLN